MKLPETGPRGMRGDDIELLPTNFADAAIVVGFDLKSRWGKRKFRELRDRPRRQQGDHDPLGSYVETRDASRSGEQNVCGSGEVGLAHYNLMLEEVCRLQRR